MIGCNLAIAFLSAASLAAPQTRVIKVADHGRTHLVEDTVDGRIDVAVMTRLASPADFTPASVTRCSGGRTSCSLADGIDITVGGDSVAVPQRAVLLLADIDRGAVMRLGAGRYELILKCGDAAAAYDAHLFFDRHRVTRMDIWSPEAGAVEQSTIYKDVSRRFS